MNTITYNLNLLVRALLLRPDAYAETLESENAFVDGAFLVGMIGFIAGIGHLIGTLIARLTVPNLDAMQAVVLSQLSRMPWFRIFQENPEAMEMFEYQYDLGWQIFPHVFGYPDPAMAALGLILTPLGLIVSWAVYGIVAHVVAKALGGIGNLSETWDVTAVAMAPHLLYVFGAVPFLTVGGVTIWTLICRYRALRLVHDLTPARATVATLTPVILLWGLLVCGGLAGTGAFISLMRGGS